jgi:PRTRC genetic system ThiF family protein
MTLQNRKIYISPRFGTIIIMGTGGTGSYLAQGLAKMIAGYQLEIDVTLVDPDVIEEKNCSRQNFQPWEIGQPKAPALAFRLNQQYGTGFSAVEGLGGPLITEPQPYRLTITCIDNITDRKSIKECGNWLDLGNGQETGQAIYGNCLETAALTAEITNWDTTPGVGSLPSPYIVAGMAGLKKTKKKAPSCADSPFAEQGIFANEWAAAAGLAILHQLLVKGQLATPAIYFDTAKGRMAPEFITKDYLNQ